MSMSRMSSISPFRIPIVYDRCETELDRISAGDTMDIYPVSNGKGARFLRPLCPPNIWFVSVRQHVNLKEVRPLTNWIVLLPDSDWSAKSQVPFNPLLVPNPMNEQYVMMYLSPPISLFHNLICRRATFKPNSDVVNRALHLLETNERI